MIRTFLAALAVCVLAACGSTTTPGAIPTPSDVADTTVLDERAALAVELAYKAETLALETAVDAGLLTGENAAKAAALDARAYAAVKAVRAAYDAGNAESYPEAILGAHAAISEALAAIKGE